MKRTILVAVMCSLLVVSCSNGEDAISLPDDLDLSQLTVAVLMDEGVMYDPYVSELNLEETNIKMITVGLRSGPVKGMNKPSLDVQHIVDEVSVDQFDALIIPGGTHYETLVASVKILEFVKNFYDSGKPVAAICGGTHVIVAAGIVDGRQVACPFEVVEALKKAGGKHKVGASAAVRDANLITAPGGEQCLDNWRREVLTALYLLTVSTP